MDGGSSMDGFVDLDEAIKAEASSRLEKVEKLAGISAMALLGAAVWLAWPTLQSGMSGASFSSEIVYALIIIAWGIFVQDLGIMDKKSRSRIGIIATIAWLPLAIIAVSYLEGNLSEMLGMVVLMLISFALFLTGRNILEGDIAVMKFRALMSLLGLVLAASLLTTINLNEISSFIQIGLCVVGLALILIDWFGKDELIY